MYLAAAGSSFVRTSVSTSAKLTVPLYARTDVRAVQATLCNAAHSPEM
jgi:hypothetical protein